MTRRPGRGAGATRGRWSAGHSARPPLCRREVLAAASLSPLAAACAAPGQGAAEIVQGRSAREVTVRWSTWGDDKNTFNTEAAPRIVALFKERFPRVTVAVEPQLGGWTTKHQVEWVAGKGPDLTGHYQHYGASWAREGFLRDLEPAMKRDVPARIRADFVEWVMRFFHIPDLGQFALPMYIGTQALFYNKVHFQRRGLAPPDESWDWNTFRDAALKLHDPQNGVFGLRQVRGYDNVAQRLHQAGADFVDPQDDRKCALDQPAAAQALTFERDANLRLRYTGREGEFEQTQGMNIWRAVSAQRFAMWEDGSWRLVRFVDQIERDVVPQWGVASLPKGPRRRSALASNDGWSIWRGSKATDEAWELLKLLQSDEFMELNARYTGNQPARKSFQDKWIKLIKETNPALADKNLKPFVDSIQQNVARPATIFRKHPEALAVITEGLNGAVFASETNKDVKNGTVALESAVRDVVQRVNDLHR